MAHEATERDVSHLEAMLEQLEGFRSGELRLDRVLAELEYLLDELRAVDTDWKARFREVCEELDTRCSVALDHQGSIPTAADAEAIDAVEQLEDLIRARLPR